MPDVSTVHFDVALTNVSLSYRNPAYVGPHIAPEVLVRKQSGRYFVHDPDGESFRPTTDARAPGAEASEVDFRLSHDSYYCDDHALTSVIPDEERENADAPLQPEIDRTEFLTDKILLNMEHRLAGALREPGALPGMDVAAEDTPWDEEAADPPAIVEEARGAILRAVQQPPNVLVLSQSVYTALRHHPKVTERVKYTNSGAVGPGALAELLDVERVLVARAVYNAASPGQEPDMRPIWGVDALLLYVPRRVGLKTVAPVITFAWSQAAGTSRGASVQTWREERRKATMIRVQKYYDRKIAAPGAAYILRNAIA